LLRGEGERLDASNLRKGAAKMTELAIPTNEMMICGAVVVLCFLLSRFRLGLSLAFAFTFYWGFIRHKDLFFVNLESSSPYLLLYFGSGILLILFALFSFVRGE
jgi:hypothetical protein